MFEQMPINPQINPYIPNFNRFQNQQHINNGITWVQGIEGAKAFQLAPNSNSILMDSENDGIFYIKTCDNVGMSNLRTFQYTEINEQPNPSNIDLSQFVTRDELEEMFANIREGGNKNGKSTVSTNAKSKPTISE